MRASVVAALVIITETRSITAQDVTEALKEVAWETDNDRVNKLISSMTPQEKISLLHHTFDAGSEDFAGYINAIPRLGLPALQVTDGESGINGVSNTTAIPSQLNVAATFSRTLSYAHGAVGGKEARLLNASGLLAPRVNILRDPVAGSFLQSYSEDPYLNAELGVSAVDGIQDMGTMANSKQIGTSSTGSSLGDANIVVDLQTLHEVYLAPHEALLRAGCATVMCSYAATNGVQDCENDEILDKTVRGMWNFTGIIMSDWGATHSTAPSIIAGLTWEMGSNDYYTSSLYDQVYIQRNLSETYLDRALGQMLTTYDRFGLLDGRGSQGNSTSPVLKSEELSPAVVQQHAGIAYDIAVRSGVLLKNNGVLPLETGLSIGVMGAAAFQITNGEGGSLERSYGITDRKVPLVDTLTNRSSEFNQTISSTIGLDMHGRLIPSAFLRTPTGEQGLQLTNMVNNETSVDSEVFHAGDTALDGKSSFNWDGQFLINETGNYRINFQRFYPRAGSSRLNDSAFWSENFYINTMTIDNVTFMGYRVYLDGGLRPVSSPLPTSDLWDELAAELYFEKGWHNISIDSWTAFGDPIQVRLNWVTPEQRASDLKQAVNLARQVDVPIIAAHTNPSTSVANPVGFPPLSLLSGYSELIEAVSEVNPNTVVVLHNTEPILMPWLKQVAGVLWMGVPGQEGGWATADLLLGLHNPQGRLPVTYPSSLNTTVTRNPAYPNRVGGVNGTAFFDEGINTAYRWYVKTNSTVLFPFGFGLSYTDFEYSDLAVVPTSPSTFDVSFTLTNIGNVAGAAVPQLYIGPPRDASTSYPGVQFAVTSLAGFDSVDLGVGASRKLTFPISERQLSFYNQTGRAWVLAKGTRKVHIATDVQTPILHGTLTIL